jgi:N utilization substance protein B
MTSEEPCVIPETFWLSLGEVKDSVKQFAEALFKGAALKAPEYDPIVEKFLKEGWTYDRLGEVEKNVMRVAVYELFECKAPYFAVIDDFVSIAKKYSDDQAAGLVNGILENIRKTYRLAAEKNEQS